MYITVGQKTPKRHLLNHNANSHHKQIFEKLYFGNTNMNEHFRAVGV